MNEQDSRQMLELYGDLVYRLAYARTGKREDAEDIFQEVFVTYVRKHPSFADEGAGRAWFARTTINHCRMFWRGKGRHATVSLEETPELMYEDPGQSELLEEISRLPEKYRRPIELYYLAGLSAKETAKALGISANAVGIRLNRGRKMLKERLQEGGTHESGKTSEFS